QPEPRGRSLHRARARTRRTLIATGGAGFMRRYVYVCLLVVVLVCPRGALGHTVYLANDNHTDYGWNASTEAYDASMLAELDYYLGRIAGNTQTKFNADCWWYLRLYQQNRSAAQFQALIDAMKAGRVTVPLNPFVQLYGAMPTEAAVRAGYYPARIGRAYGV